MADELLARMQRDAVDTRPTGSSEELASLSDLISQAQSIQADVEQLERELVNAKADLRRLTDELIPDALDAAGVRRFETANGLEVTCDVLYSATLGRGRDEDAADHRNRVRRALRWLRESGNAGLIRSQLIARLDDYDAEVQRAARAALEDLGVSSERKDEVHPSTLRAFVNERMREGDPVPLEDFRVAEFRHAKIKARKRS